MSVRTHLSRLPASVRAAVVVVALIGTVMATVSVADSAGRTLRVAPGAGGNCVSSPCGSIVAAARVAQSGDVIELASGSYGDQTVDDVAAAAGWSQNVVVRPAAGASVTVGALRSYVPNMTFQDMRITGIVYLYPEAHKNRVERMNFDEAQAYVTGADDTVWVGNRIKPPIGQDGIQIKARTGDNAERTQLLMNTIGPAYRTPLSHTDCIQLLGAHDTIIAGNRLYECANTGVQIGNGAGGTVDGVLIESNVIDECAPRREGCDGHHTIIVGSTVANTVRIANNHLNGSVGIGGTTGGAPLITGNFAHSLPCTPKTSGNRVLGTPCPGDTQVSSAPSSPPPPPTNQPPTTAAPTTRPPTTAAPTTAAPTTRPPTTAAPTTQPTVQPPAPPQPPSGDRVTETHQKRIHSKAPTTTFDFTSGAGAVDVDVWVRDSWLGRAWTTVQLVDARGLLIAQAFTGPTDRVSLRAHLDQAGPYRVIVTGKTGEVNLTVIHPR